MGYYNENVQRVLERGNDTGRIRSSKEAGLRPDSSGRPKDQVSASGQERIIGRRRWMKSFRNFIIEAADQAKTLHAFDMDETIIAHDPKKLKIHVVDPKGKIVDSLTNQEYNTHHLQPGHRYDYRDFQSSDVFRQSAHPIRKMLAKMKAIHNNGGKVEIVTARSDFDDKHKFAKEMARYGVDINKIHVRRSGNLNPAGNAAVNKAAMISQLIQKHGYKKVHLYDDSHSNLEHFLALKDRHPDVDFHAHHVAHDPKTDDVKISSKTS